MDELEMCAEVRRDIFYMSTLKIDWIFLKVFNKPLKKVVIFLFDIDSLNLPVMFLCESII